MYTVLEHSCVCSFQDTSASLTWQCVSLLLTYSINQQESCAVTREPRDAAAAVFRLKFVDNIHYKFKSSQASKARLRSSKHSSAKQNLMQNGHSRSRVLESVERR